MVTVTERIGIAFRGADAGVGELSWGQRELWGGMVKQGSWFPIGAVLPLPAGTTLDAVVARLRRALARHPTLRTRLARSGERVRQRVAGAGEIALEVVDTGPAEDPEAVAQHLAQRYREADLDVTAEWPVRAAVVRRHGAPSHLVVIMCHLVTDGFGAVVLAGDLRAEPAPEPAGPGGPIRVTQPLAQAAWQGSPAGQRQNRLALRHWERLLRTIPARRWPGPGEPAEPRYWQAHLDSPAAWLAVQLVAGRTGLDTSQVLLAMFLTALGRLQGTDPVVSRVIVNNRFRPGLAEVVAPVSQTGLVVVDAATTPVRELLDGIRRTALTAYKHAYYDPAQLQVLTERIGAERGEELDTFTFLNDRRVRHRGLRPGPPPGLAEIRAAARRDQLRWGGRMARPTERFFVHIDDRPETLGVTLWADTCYVPPAGIEAFLRGLAGVAVEAATAVTTPGD